MWTILIFIVIGMVAGWAASLLIRREKYPTDWGVLFIIGVSGSLIAGIVVNLIMGDGFKIAPGGIIGSIAVACLLLWLYTRAQNRDRQGAGAPDRQSDGRTASARAARSTTPSVSSGPRAGCHRPSAAAPAASVPSGPAPRVRTPRPGR